MEMAQYILSILRSQLMIVFSWGFNTPIAIEDGLQFNVEGFKHQGKVRVHYNGGSDLFDVTTLNRDGSFSYTLPGPIPEAEDGKTRIAVRLNASFSTGADSPVMALSSACKRLHSKSRASAGT